MDFSLLEKHPWETAGIVVGGGVLLFFLMRRGSSAPVDSTVGYSGGVDPQTAAYQAQASAQTAQAQTYIEGLQLQGATQVSLAQIGADVSKFSTTAGVDVTDNRTASELALGLGTLGAQVEITRIQAGLQSKYIDAIVAAFGGSMSPSVTPGPITTPTGGYYPTSQITPAQSVSIQPPNYNTLSPGVGSVNPGTTPPGGSWFCLPGHDCDPSGFDRTARLNGDLQPAHIPAPLPGGTQLVPNYTVPYCDPRDVTCVTNNGSLATNWQNSTMAANSNNNRNQCLANAELSRGFPNYPSLVSACG